MLLRYGQYARKSDDDKTITEKSLNDQVTELAPIVQRERLNVLRTWQESKSARIPHKRKEYGEMIALIEAGALNAIICWHINRLVRNMEEGGKLVQLFVDGKIQEIRTASGTYRTGDNILPLVIEAASAAQYSIDLTKRVSVGMRSKFERGGWNHKVPQGYLNGRDPVNPNVGIILRDPRRYDLIRKAWEMFLTGAYSPVEVVRTLNEVWGYRIRQTKELASRPLSSALGYTLFRNPFYAGFVSEKGKIIKIPNFEPMVSSEEFARAQALLGRRNRSSRTRHNHAYAGLMVCGYCGRLVTGEKRKISSGVWENYRCANPDGTCTSMGMSRSAIETQILETLKSVTVDPLLCRIALDNILEDLHTNTEPIAALYTQQNEALAAVEAKLSNLADGWIAGVIRDPTIYQTKESALIAERNNLIMDADRCRTDLERMRANAMSASNYVTFARENFTVASDTRKREIAHALGIGYALFGREKRISLTVEPLLLEFVKFANLLKSSFEPTDIGFHKEKAGDFSPALSFGRPELRKLELPKALSDQLKGSMFIGLGSNQSSTGSYNANWAPVSGAA